MRGMMDTHFLMDIQLSEDLGGIQKMLVIDDSFNNVRIFYFRAFLPFSTNFFAFHASKGKLRMKASQYPLMRNRAVKKACTAASGMIYVFNRLQRSIGLI
jgi:hypothetical protein